MPLQGLQRGLDALERRVRRIDTREVNTVEDRAAVRDFARSYFGTWRGAIVVALGGEEPLQLADSVVQALVTLSQHRARVTEYQDELRRLRRTVGDLELLVLRRRIEPPPVIDRREALVLDALKRLSESAAKSYEQGLRDLAAGNRGSWRGTAVEFREALREALDSLAPDADVTKQAGYKQEKDTHGPTMRQKAIFVLKARRRSDAERKPFASAMDIIDELIGAFCRGVYTRSSVAVHVSPTRAEAAKLADYVTLVLRELLEVGS